MHRNVLSAASLYRCHSTTVLSRLAESRKRLPLQLRSKMSSWWPRSSFAAGVWNGSAAASSACSPAAPPAAWAHPPLVP